MQDLVRRAISSAGQGALACALWTSALSAASPRVEIRETEIDLGQLTRVESATGRFAIRNAGDEVLLILGADPSCGCTVVDFDEMIQPGETGYIEATLEVSSLHGMVSSQIHVATDDPVRPQLVLTLRAEVIGAVQILPVDDVFMLSRAGRLPVARRLLRKAPEAEGKLKIRDLEASAGWLEARVEQLDAPRPMGGGLPEAFPGDWLLTIAVVGEPAYGKREESVRFSTGLPGEPVVQVPVVLSLLPPVNLSTERVVLSPELPEVTVALSVREGTDPSQLRAVAEPAALQAKLEPGDGRFFKLHVKGTDELAGTSAAVVFHVGLETLRLTVVWSAAPAGAGR